MPLSRQFVDGSLRTQLPPSVYNALLQVEEANSGTRSLNVDAMMQELSPVFAKYNVLHMWGLTLLHRHWRIGKGEIPVESLAYDEKGSKYITKPLTPEQGTTVPNVLQFTDTGQVQVLEFSDTKRSRGAYEALSDGFLEEVCAILQHHGAYYSFGLRSLREVEHNGSFVELTSDDCALSITREMKDDEAHDYPVMRTLWTFNRQAAYCGKYHGCDIHSKL